MKLENAIHVLLVEASMRNTPANIKALARGYSEDDVEDALNCVECYAEEHGIVAPCDNNGSYKWNLSKVGKQSAADWEPTEEMLNHDYQPHPQD